MSKQENKPKTLEEEALTQEFVFDKLKSRLDYSRDGIFGFNHFVPNFVKEETKFNDAHCSSFLFFIDGIECSFSGKESRAIMGKC